jgi:hypothetical protein
VTAVVSSVRPPARAATPGGTARGSAMGGGRLGRHVEPREDPSRTRIGSRRREGHSARNARGNQGLRPRRPGSEGVRGSRCAERAVVGRLCVPSAARSGLRKPPPALRQGWGGDGAPPAGRSLGGQAVAGNGSQTRKPLDHPFRPRLRTAGVC